MKKYFFPKYDEVSLFLTVLAGILVLVLHKELINGFIAETESDGQMWIVGLFVIYGAIISIYHAFSKKIKSDFDKESMAIFALIVNGVAGIAGAAAVSADSQGWFLIFPILNFLTSVWLFIILRVHPNVGSFIDDTDAELRELVIGMIAVLIIFCIFEFQLKAPWAITFGAVVGYATMLNRSVNSFLGSRS